MKESTLQRQIVAYLQGRGAYVFKAVGSAYQQAGTPDLLVCWRGLFIGLEIKVPGKRSTPVQDHEIHKIREAGGCGAVVKSIEDVEGVLDIWKGGAAWTSQTDGPAFAGCETT